MMKKMYLVAGLVLLGLVLPACRQEAKSTGNTSSTSTATPAGKEDSNVVEEVKSVLLKYNKALNDKNLDTLLATFSYDPRTVVLGTGTGERYVGQDAIRERYSEILKDYDPGTRITNCEWKTGGVDPAGTTAWVAATCQGQDSLKNVKRDYVLNISGALRKDDKDWRFLMLHMSDATRSAPRVAAKVKSAPAR